MNIIKIKHFLFAVMGLCLFAWASADTFTYDKLNRLTTVAFTCGGGQAFSYDAAGNLLATRTAAPASSPASTPIPGCSTPVSGSYTLSVSVSGSGTVTGGGINCGSTCSASLTSGTQVILTATAASGSTFTGWGGACTGTGTCTVTMSQARSVTATFSSAAGYALLSVSRSGSGAGTVTSSPAGISCGAVCTASMPTGSSVTLTATPSAGSTFTGWSGACTGSGTCVVSMNVAKSVTATFATSMTKPSCTLTAMPSSIAVGASSTLSATCTPAATSYTWTGGTCAATSASSCTVTPAATTTYTVTGTNANGAGAAASATVTVGTSLSLIDHYYSNILNRAADTGGKNFWQGAVTQMSSLGVSQSEVYIVMASNFYTSGEFLARNLSDEQYVDNLYRTFLNRAADTAGVDYWKSLIAAGLPRDMVMYGFMFSSEFASFMQQQIGSSSQRPEVGAVIDYYRGILGRLPEPAGYTYWVNQFRAAQCASNSTADVYAAATSIAASFFGSAEYTNGAPAPRDYVADLYNAFMRRIAEPGGYYYWIDQITTGAQSKEQARQAFINSPEFAARVQAIATASCVAMMP